MGTVREKRIPVIAKFIQYPMSNSSPAGSIMEDVDGVVIDLRFGGSGGESGSPCLKEIVRTSDSRFPHLTEAKKIANGLAAGLRWNGIIL